MAKKVTKREKVSREWIKLGDILYNEISQELSKYKGMENFFTEEENLRRKNLISAKMALVCEYYLKGFCMQEISISLSDDMKQILNSRLGKESLSEDEEIALIQGDNINELILKAPDKYSGLKILQNSEVDINGKRNKALKVLQKELKDKGLTFTSISHDLSTALNKISESSREKIALNYMNTYELDFLNELDSMPYQETENPYEVYFDMVIARLDYIINVNEVKEAFPKGRYGSCSSNLFEADIDTLDKFMKILKELIPVIIHNAIPVNNERHIFPDECTDILIYDDNNQSLLETINYNRINSEKKEYNLKLNHFI